MTTAHAPVLHSRRCLAYLRVLARNSATDPTAGRTLADVDRIVHDEITAGALSCTCYIGAGK